MASKIKKGMTVVVLSGEERGKQGRVLAIDRAKGRAVVEGVNMIRRAMRPNRQNPAGGMLEREAAIPLSRLGVWDADAKRPARVRIEVKVEMAGGKKRRQVRRVSHRSGKAVE